METKYCKHCGKTLPIEYFSKDRKNNDGYAFYCKECCAEYGRRFRKTPEGIYQNIKGRVNHREKHNMGITQDEFVAWYNDQPRVCVYCDITEDNLHLIKFKQLAGIKRLTIDCKDNNIGYQMGNLVLACNHCNFFKSNFFTFDEMRRIGQEIIKPKWQKWLKENELSSTKENKP